MDKKDVLKRTSAIVASVASLLLVAFWGIVIYITVKFAIEFL